MILPPPGFAQPTSPKGKEQRGERIPLADVERLGKVASPALARDALPALIAVAIEARWLVLAQRDGAADRMSDSEWAAYRALVAALSKIDFS